MIDDNWIFEFWESSWVFGPGGSFFVWVGGMNGGRHDHAAAPLAVCPFCFLGV